MRKLSKSDIAAALMAVLLPVAAVSAVAQTPPVKSSPAMERTEHQWTGKGAASSTFDALWSGRELKMIREELQAADGMVEKNEYVFNQGALLHYKQDRYSVSGKSGPETATMVSFDKTGKPVISMRRIDGNPAGPASPQTIAAAKKHLAELLAITGKAKR